MRLKSYREFESSLSLGCEAANESAASFSVADFQAYARMGRNPNAAAVRQYARNGVTVDSRFDRPEMSAEMYLSRCNATRSVARPQRVGDLVPRTASELRAVLGK